MQFSRVWSASLAAFTLLAAAGTAEARITRIDIKRVESPTFEGRSFGTVGPYEKLVGRAYGEINPADPRNAAIVDLSRAPKNARGMVEYDTDITILKPVNLANGNHRVWFEVNNRGNLLAFPQLNDALTGGNDPTKAVDAGNGFLMRQGYSILNVGWDISAAPGNGRATIRVPVASNADGTPIVGPALDEFVIDDAMTRTGALSYPAASLDKSRASLTMRVRVDDTPIEVPAAAWDYTDTTGTAVQMADGSAFKPGMLYEFAYQAKNPLVAGIGFAAIRDAATFLRRMVKDEAGNLNPLAGNAQYIYSGCVSQPCRTLHDFVWLGFNDDGTGKRAIDGMVHWIGGATGIFMNYRFAQPARTHRQHIGRWFPEFQPPFTNQVITDPISGKADGRLGLCSRNDTCPKIFEVNSENEYWAKNMAVGHLDGTGKDLGDAPGVRNYLLASLPHQAGVGATGPGICQLNRNPLVANAVLRALLVAMDEWVSLGKEPPPSRLPRLADGTLAPPLPQAAMGFPAIPGVKYNGRMHTGDLFDFGPAFEEGILSNLPPKKLGTPYAALVPRTDADGNGLAGIRLPEIAAPIATYTGWSIRAQPESGDEGCDAAGQMIDFARTKAQRMANGDPRPSIEERYPTRAAYVSAVGAAAAGLVRERLLLEEDAQAYVRRAQDSTVGN